MGKTLAAAVLTLCCALLPAQAESGIYCCEGEAAQSAVCFDHQWQDSGTGVSPWGWQGGADRARLFRLSCAGESFHAYCADFTTGIIPFACYRRIAPEQASYFDEETAARLRGILTCGYRADWTQAELEEAAQAAGLEALTADEAMSATQLAVWTAANTNALMGGHSDGRHRLVFRRTGGSALPEATEGFLRYLLACPPIPRGEAQDAPLIAGAQARRQGEGVTVCLALADGADPEGLTLTAAAGGERQVVPLDRLEQTEEGYVLALSAAAEDGITLTLSGVQTAAEVCFYEALTVGGGSRSASQNLIGWAEAPTAVSDCVRIAVPAHAPLPEDTPPLAEVPDTGGFGSFPVGVSAAAALVLLLLRAAKR